MKYYVPKIKIVRCLNNKVNPYLLCKCGEFYSEHIIDGCYCNEFQPIHFKESHKDDFLEYLDKNNCNESILNICEGVYYDQLDVRKLLCLIMEDDYYPEQFSDYDLQHNINIKELKQFVHTLVLENVETKPENFRRQVMNNRKGS